jgi:gamma-glutamyltranspeptidase/glutathione hydrolase
MPKKKKIFVLIFSVLFFLIPFTGFNQNSVKRGVVSSASPEATSVGIKILERGGNAIDAAVAISFALGVVESAMSGLGGGTQILLSIPGKTPFLINGTTFAPALTDVNISSDSLIFHKRSTIPSTVKVLFYAWKKYGSRKFTWSQLLEPSIHLAANGFVVGQFRADVYRMYEKSMTSSPFHTNLWLKDGKTIPAKGEILKQPILAKTLTRLAKYGAIDFYEGEIAKAIARDMEQNGGWIRMNDLKNFPEPVELPALSVNYNQYKVYSMPPPGGGYAMLQILTLHEKSFTNKNQLSEFETWARILKAVHQDRDINPIDNTNNYEQQVQDKLSDAYIEKLNLVYNINNSPKEKSGETTHFSVVDKKGMAVALTASINAYFGAKAASSELGFLYNSYMDDFEFNKPNHPAAIRPGAMAFSSMCPTIVQKNGKTVLIAGTPGSSRIISTVAQIVANWIKENDIEKVVYKKRYHVSGNTFYAEDARLKDSLQKNGLTGFVIKSPSDYLLRNGLNSYFGGVHAIALQKGKWVGSADPRRDGTAGYTMK